MPVINVNAADAVNIGNTSATIKGINYRIDEQEKIIYLSSNAIVELTGNAEDYRVATEENAKNVSVTLNNYQASINRGWNINTIELKNGSSVRLTLVGTNKLSAGPEASAIRVPKNTSLVIDGIGTLYAEVDNGGSGACSAVIGSQYHNPFGDITINGGNIYTSHTMGFKAGIGAGDGRGYDVNIEEMSGTITLNGGNIHTELLGSVTNKDKVSLQGNGNAVLYTDELDINSNGFNGIVFEGNKGTVKGNATLTQDMNLSSDTELTIEEGASLTIPENVTVTNNGKIVNKGTINNTGTFQNNNGSIDNTDGNITSTTDIENVDGNDIKIILYSITVNVGAGGTVNPNKHFEVEHGQTQMFDILPNKGYKIKSVIVNGEDKTNEVIDGKLTLENITKDMTINVEFEKIPEVQQATLINKDNVESPKTSDNILFYFGLGLASIIGISLLGIYYKEF